MESVLGVQGGLGLVVGGTGIVQGIRLVAIEGVLEGFVGFF